MVAAPSIAVLDDGADRGDLRERRETKYVFTDHDPAALRNVLQRTCRPIVYAGPVSTVRSVYFDDPVLSSARANLDGIGLRHKTRLRWYDTEYPGDRFFLEVKWRRHRVCGKHRTELSCDTAVRDLSFRALHAALRRTAPATQTDELRRDTEAVVVVEYRREHFALRDGAARLTLDYDLRFYPLLGRRRLGLRFPERRPDIALIECKAAPDDVPSLHGALAPLRARPARFSKYVTGCQALGYVTTV